MPFYPEMGAAWTEKTPLPGGVMPNADFAMWLTGFQARQPWLPDALACHYGRAYGTAAEQLIQGASSVRDLGHHFGGLFYECEARWLCAHEWARTAEDILTRRTKHGLFLNPDQQQAFHTWMQQQQDQST